MKKTFITCYLFLLSLLSVQAQSNTTSARWGVKIGANFASITGADVQNAQTLTDFYAGFLVEIPLAQKFAIQPELYYSQQGYTHYDKYIDQEGNSYWSYLHLPVLAKYYLVPGLSIQAGPQIGVNLSEDVFQAIPGSMTGGDIAEDQIIPLDISIIAGLGYKFNGHFFINWRYGYGLTKLTADGKAHNSVFQLGVGYMF